MRGEPGVTQHVSSPGSSESSPQVSVVITAYNEEKRLAATLQALRDQTYTDFEVIIVDDGSTDATAGIARAFTGADRRFRLEVLPRVGRGRALNAGVRLARGKYVAINDADDRSLPDRLARQVEYLDTHPECVLLGCGALIVDEQGNGLGMRQPPAEDARLRRLLAIGNPFVHSTVVYRRDALMQAGMFSEALPCAIDYDMIVRISRFGMLSSLPEVLVLHQRHGEQKFRSGIRARRRWKTAAQIAVRASWRYHRVMLPVSFAILAVVSLPGGGGIDRLHALYTRILHRTRELPRPIAGDNGAHRSNENGQVEPK